MLDDRDLVRHLRLLETQARRLPAVMQRVVAVLEERRVARRHGLRDTAALLRRELQVSAGEARSRVAAANQLAADAGLDAGGEVGAGGEAGPPNLVATARAQAWGQLSPAHVRVIQQALDELPLALRATKATELEAMLVAEARQLDPHRLGMRARQLLAELDPDRLRRQERGAAAAARGEFRPQP